MLGRTTVTGDEAVARRMGLAGAKLEQAIAGAVAEVALNVETAAKKNVRDNGTTDTARLVSAIGTEFSNGGLEAEVKAATQYAAAVEGGSAPHWVPIGPLKDWARRKLGDEDAAYAVQAKIAAEGTKAQPFMTPAREQELPKVPATVAKHARRVTGR